jgi:hypothetical protein
MSLIWTKIMGKLHLQKTTRECSFGKKTIEEIRKKEMCELGI